jgi:hypothetical protein
LTLLQIAKETGDQRRTTQPLRPGGTDAEPDHGVKVVEFLGLTGRRIELKAGEVK